MRQFSSSSSDRFENQEMVMKQHEAERKRVEVQNKCKTKLKVELGVKIMNIDGLTPKKLELDDYINQKEPVIVCQNETKLK